MLLTRETRLALFVRVLIALCTRTFFQPDEYFQALEPAYAFVFGYGHITWEWRVPRPIRSIVYPALNVPVYWALKVSGLTDASAGARLGWMGDWLLIAAPRVLHGIFAAATDVWVFELTRVVHGGVYASTAYFLSLTSFFHALALSRSLSNSLETSLSTVAYAFYPWDASPKLSPHLMYNRSKLRKTLAFSVLACMVRPTNAVIWVFLYGKLLWALRTHRKIALALITEIAVIGIAGILFQITLDTLYYNKLTFTAYNFLRTNLSPVSLFYGSNPWHYYLTQALPILCTTALPFALHGVYSALRLKRNTAPKTVISTIAWTIGVYSFGGHKEWRFIHPILPLLHVLAAKSLVDFSYKHTTSHTRNFIFSPLLPPIRPAFTALLLVTLPISLYIILFYCSAPLTVLAHLRSLPRDELGRGGLGFLMPCHSTPAQAYLHRPELANGRMWALGCEPPLTDHTTYRDQTDVFFSAPKVYLETRFPAIVNPTFPISRHPVDVPGDMGGERWSHEWPLYLVFFGELLKEEGVRGLLEERGYQEAWKRGREWEGEGQRKGGVRVWKWVKL